jgi:anti-sigma factor RsiW
MNDQLTIEDLRAYQNGLLSGPARHRVERLLLENPFYADALDGLEALQRTGDALPTQTAKIRVALQKRVQQSATQQRLMPLWTTALVACILLVLAIAVYLIFFVPKT